MFGNITLGQYLPGDSPIHALDPRTKLLLTLAYIVLIFLVEPIWMFLVPLLFVVAVILIGRIPFSYVLRSLKPMRFLIVFMLIINVFFTSGTTVWFSFWGINVTEESVMRAIFISIRLILLVCGTTLMMLTTSPLALTDGIERLLSPLAKIRFPAHELAMMMTIALRFIPTLMEETDKIKKAQMARGADFESGNFFKRVKSMIPILVPLFISAFRRADELAMAMEARCYHGGKGRTRLRILRFASRDAYAAGIVVVMGAAIVLVQELVLL